MLFCFKNCDVYTNTACFNDEYTYTHCTLYEVLGPIYTTQGKIYVVRL